MSNFTYQTPSKPRRPVSRFHDHPQPWTTARCHRILRPLISRIASLKRDSIIAARITAASSIATSAVHQHHDEHTADSGWLMPKKKRPRLTYSQRRGGARQLESGPQSHGPHEHFAKHEEPSVLQPQVVRKSVKSLKPEMKQRPGEIVVATPFLKRARGHFLPSPESHESNVVSTRSWDSFGARRSKGVEDRLARLRRDLPRRHADFDAIYRSLEALLKATAPTSYENLDKRRGPRSLLDMCLRRVPQYIAELEAWERLEAEQNGTISTLDEENTSAGIYTYLETFGTNVGWKHLRTVVRADGLDAIKRGITEGLFGDDFSQLLIDLCIQSGAASEAEDLIHAMVSREYSQPTSIDNNFAGMPGFQPLLYLNSFVPNTGRCPSFVFRQYRELLSKGHLPQDWLVTSNFERIWSLATRELATPQANADAVSFVVLSTYLLCSRTRIHTGSAESIKLEQDMSQASQRVCASALGIIVSLSLLGEMDFQAQCGSKANMSNAMITSIRLRYIIRACISKLESHHHGQNGRRVDCLYFASFLASTQTQGYKVQTRITHTIKQLSSARSISAPFQKGRTWCHFDAIAWLLASISRSVSRGTSESSHHCLNILFKRLLSVGLASHLLDGLKAHSAFLIAQETNNVRDLIYAESLNPDVPSSDSSTKRRGSVSTLFSGYRWEETIGEWVTSSPVLKKHVAPTRKHHRSSIGPIDAQSHSTAFQHEAQSHAGSVSKTKTVLDAEINSEKRDKRDRACHLRHRISSETLTTTAFSMSTIGRKASSKGQEPGELHDNMHHAEKENRVRLLAKKPRRSSGRIVIGVARTMRHAGEHDEQGDYSDDELCA
ncbi:hypothetical protein GGR57DRAFT_136526 [Xylariaceae sp. FL1272]|nr:hypothetical protein GGR57DRAFT_136526 [Xylariaceae sp. FL1272]